MSDPLADMLRRLRMLERRIDRVGAIESPGIRCILEPAADPSIPTGVPTTINCGTILVDTDGMYTAPGTMTVQTAGTYLLAGTAYYDAIAGGAQRILYILLNGGTIVTVLELPVLAGYIPQFAIAMPYVCAVADTIQIVTFQDSGGPTPLHRILFGAVRIG